MGVIKAANAPPSMTPFSMRDIEQQARMILLRAKSQAEKLLAAAQAEGENLKRAAAEQGLSQGRAQGIKEGIDQGRKTGHDQALAEHKVKLQAVVQALTEAVGQLNTSRIDLEGHAVKEVIQLAAEIARRITRRQGMLEPAVLEENLAEAVKLAIHGADVRIAIHPQQLQYLRETLPRIQKTWPRFSHVELVEDPTVSAGGCRLLAAGGVVDADLETQLDRVIGQLLPAT